MSLLNPSAWCYFALTLATFLTAYKLQQSYRWTLLNPVVLSIALLATGLYWLQIPYSDYQQGGQWINWFLEPSVVALGYPLYQQRHAIKKDALRLLIICAFASILGILSMLILCSVLGLSAINAISGSAKAITTAIAMVISEQQGGLPALTTLTVIFAGLLGSLLAIPLMRLTGIHHAKAQGLAMGCASHALGTARIKELGHTQGAFSALALVLCAIFTALFSPFLLPWFFQWW